MYRHLARASCVGLGKGLGVRPVPLILGNSVRALHNKKDVRSTLNYVIALGVLTVGLSYAAVPLYRIFCQVSTPYSRMLSKARHLIGGKRTTFRYD